MEDGLSLLISELLPKGTLNSARVAYDEGKLVVTPDRGDPYTVEIPDGERGKWLFAWAARRHSWLGLKSIAPEEDSA